MVSPSSSSTQAEAPWKAIARRKQADRAAQIPARWRIPTSFQTQTLTLTLPKDPPQVQDGPQNVVDVPRQFLSPAEISITESYSVTRLLSALAAQELSAVEVAEAFSHRAALAQQLTNCVTEPLFERAIRRAQELDRHLQRHGRPVGPLHGLPVSVKDSFDVEGVDSSIGLAYLCYKPATKNAVLVDLLLSLGCVIVAKTNVPQTLASLDSINNVFGRTMNPINRLCTAGGSSGGEGVLVAMRGSMIGIGTDIGGSIRVPAMCNGLYGFKPSNGRLPYGGQALTTREGISRTSVQAVAGPIARSVEDLDVLLRELVPRASLWGEDCLPMKTWESPSFAKPPAAPRQSLYSSQQRQPPDHDLGSGIDLPAPRGSGKNGEFVIGILRSDGNCTLLPPITHILDEVATHLRATANVSVIELDCPAAWTKSQSVMNKLMGVDGSEVMADMIQATQEPLVPWMATRFRKGKPQSLETVAALQAERADLEREMLQQLWTETETETETNPVRNVNGSSPPPPRRQRLDAIICPVAPHPVPLIDSYNAVGMTSSWVLLDNPAGTVPIRLCQESDLLLGRPQGGRVLGSWDRRNRELWDETKIDRTVYLGTPLSVQVVVPRLQDEKLIQAMMVVDDAVKSGSRTGGGVKSGSRIDDAVISGNGGRGPGQQDLKSKL